MGILRLYEGHYRALENDFIRLASRLVKGGDRITVVAAGSEQLQRLKNLLLDSLPVKLSCGIDFLPGLPFLARKLSPIPGPVSCVSPADRHLFSREALNHLAPGEPLHALRDSPAASASMASFFEDLLDRGITPEIYRLSAMSMQGEPTDTEQAAGKAFNEYWRLRQKHYCNCTDQLLGSDLPPVETGDIILYGFYDLNPSQRRFVRLMIGFPARIHWFTPLESGSRWAEAFRHTGSMLEKMDAFETIRSGGKTGMNDFAAFFESGMVQYRPSIPSGGFRVTAAAGETGACRAALDRIIQLSEQEGVPFSSIAVIRRKERGGSLIRMAVHENVPVASPLTSPVSDLPAGMVLSGLLDLEENGFHYTLLRDLASTGMLRDDISPSPEEIGSVVRGSGIRFGRLRWRDWYAVHGRSPLASMLEILDSFFDDVPSEAPSSVYLRMLERLFLELVDIRRGSIPAAFLFDTDLFRSCENIHWKMFAEAYRQVLNSLEVTVRSGDPDGFRVLSAEEARGGYYRSVILMDMEEEVYPGRITEDPRLSDDLRERLQLPRKTMRETADGFLLRQAGEAAAGTLDLIYRRFDSRGKEVYPSPFISGIVSSIRCGSSTPNWFVSAPASPVHLLLGGGNPGQRRAMAASCGTPLSDPRIQRITAARSSRMDTSCLDEFDGLLQMEVEITGACNPTMLESYMECPFAFLVGRIWNIGERGVVGDPGELDPSLRGRVVHGAVAEILSGPGLGVGECQVSGILGRTIDASGGRFGSDLLRRVFIEKHSAAICRCLSEMDSLGWEYVDSERFMEGGLGDISINGRVDLILRAEGKLVLADLKTGKLPSRTDTLKGKVFQLPFYYALVLQNCPGQDIDSACYLSVSPREAGKAVSLSSTDLEKMMDEVHERTGAILENMRRGIFPPVPGRKCDYCGYSHLCRNIPDWRLEDKLRNYGQLIRSDGRAADE